MGDTSPSKNTEVLITGFGSVTSLGIHSSDIWQTLSDPAKREKYYDSSSAAPFLCHPAHEFDPKSYVSSKETLRQLGAAQLHALVSAIEALKSAGIDPGSTLLHRAALMLASSEGELDDRMEERLYKKAQETIPQDVGRIINAHYARCRPLTALSALPNLYSHHVSSFLDIGGESDTFTGDELAGMNAFDVAVRKIRAGESDIVLVGGSTFATKHYFMLYAALANQLCRGDFVEVWTREAGRLCLGTGSAFLVLESQSHAEDREAKKCYRLANYDIQSGDRSAASFLEGTKHQLDSMMGGTPRNHHGMILSSSCGKGGLSSMEAELFHALNYQRGLELPIRSVTNYSGALLEAALPFGLVMACMCLRAGRVLPAFFQESEIEKASQCGDKDLAFVLLNCWGHYAGEAAVMLERYSL